MGFKLFVQARIIPQFITVAGSQGPEQVLNMAGLLPLPENILYKPLDWDQYSAEVTKRTLLHQTAAEGDSDNNIFFACPGLRDWKAKQIRNQGEFRLRQLVGHYQESERETWPYQREEALRWSTGGMQSTPYCDAIALGRGVPREAFLKAVLENTTLFTTYSAAILGRQQAILDRIYSASTVAAVLAENW